MIGEWPVGAVEIRADRLSPSFGSGELYIWGEVKISMPRGEVH